MNEQCRKCRGKCCTYFCLEIDRPSSFEDYENVRWFILHKAVSVHIDKGHWFLAVDAPCLKLDKRTGRCTNYAGRPMICREYSDKGCDFDDGAYEYQMIFRTPASLARYARRKLGRAAYDKARRTMIKDETAAARGRLTPGRGAKKRKTK